MTTRIRRTELFAKVWEKPVLKVARDLGISDVALHKICRKHDIPVPPRGHWAKVAAGKRVSRPPALGPGSMADDFILITGPRTAGLPKSVQDALAEGKAAEQSHHVEQAGPPSPHILRLRADLDSAKPKKGGFISLTGRKQFRLMVTPECKERAYLALSRLVGAANQRGVEIVPSEHGLAFQIGEDQVSLSVTEPMKKVPHVPTDREKILLDKWEESCRRKKALGQWISKWDRPNVPEKDEVHSGQILIDVDEHKYHQGIRRKYSDGKHQRVENLSERIITAVVACAAASKQKRIDDARREKEYQEEQRRRAEAERVMNLAKKRLELQDAVSKWLNRADQMDTFVANYRSSFPDQNLPEICEMFLSWISDQASYARSRVAPDKLADTIGYYQLMDDQTKLSSWVSIEIEPRRRY